MSDNSIFHIYLFTSFLVFPMLFLLFVITKTQIDRKKFFKLIVSGNCLKTISDFPELLEIYEVIRKSKESILVKNMKTEKLSEISVDDLHHYELD